MLPPVAHSWFRALGYCDDRAARAEDDARVLDEVHPADPRALEDDEEEEKEEEEEEEEDEEEDDDAYHVDDHLDDHVDDHRAVRAAEVRACPDRELRDFIQDYADLFTPAAVAFAVSKIARRGLYLARDDHTVWTPDARDADRSDADRFDRFDADRFDADASHRPRPRPRPRGRASRRRGSPHPCVHALGDAVARTAHRMGPAKISTTAWGLMLMNRACPIPPHVAEAVDASLSAGVDVLQRRRRRAPRRRHVRRGLGAGFEPGTKEHFKRVSSRRMDTTANAARVSSALGDATAALFAATAAKAPTEMRFRELRRAAAATATWAERRGAPAREMADAVVAVNKGMTRALPRLTFTFADEASGRAPDFATRGALSRTLRAYGALIRAGHARVRTGLQRAVFDAVTRALPETDGFEWNERELLGVLASTGAFASLGDARRDRSDASSEYSYATSAAETSSSDASRVPDALRDAIFLAIERALDRTALGFFPAASARRLSTFATRDFETFRARVSTSEAMHRCVLRLVPELDARGVSALAFELARAEAAGALVLSDEVRDTLRDTAAKAVAAMPSRTAVSALNARMRAEHAARKARTRDGRPGAGRGADSVSSEWDASTNHLGETNLDALFAAATRDVASFREWDAALLARVAGYFRERPGSTFAKPPARELVAALDDAAREFVAGCRGDDERDAGGDEERPPGASSSSSPSSHASASLTVFEEYAKLRAVDGNPFEITSETMWTLLDAAVANLPDATYAQLEAFCAAIRRADDDDASREKRETRAFASRARDATEARMLATVASNPPWKRPRAPGSALRLAFAWRDAFGVDATASMRDDLRLAMAEELAVKSRHMDPRTVVETLGVAADMGSNAPMTGATFAALKSSLARAGRDRGPHSPATLRAALDALARLTHPKNAALGRGDKVLTRRLASRLCGDVEETWDSIRSSSRASSNPGFEFADAVADLRRLAACANWGRPDGWFWTESVPAAAAIARAAETTTESATIEDAIDALGVLGKLRASFRNVAEGDGARETPETEPARRSRRNPNAEFEPEHRRAPRHSPHEFPSEISRVADALLRRVESAAREGATPFGAADGRDVARASPAAAAFARDDATRATLPRIQGLLAVAETLARLETSSTSDDEVGSYSDDEVGSYSDGSRSRPAARRGMSRRDASGVTLRALVELADADAAAVSENVPAAAFVPAGLLDALDARVARDAALSVSSETPSDALFTLASDWESACRLALVGATMPSGVAAGNAALRLAREHPNDVTSRVAARIVRCVADAETIRENASEHASEQNARLAAALVERRAASWDPRTTAATAPAVATLTRRFPESNEVIDGARAFLLACASTTTETVDLDARELAAVTRACAEVAEVAEVASARGAWKGNAAEETAAAAEAARRAASRPRAATATREIRAEIAAAVERMEAAARGARARATTGEGRRSSPRSWGGGEKGETAPEVVRSSATRDGRRTRERMRRIEPARFRLTPSRVSPPWRVRAPLNQTKKPVAVRRGDFPTKMDFSATRE